MKENTQTTTPVEDLAWLKKDDPEIYHLLCGLEGGRDALNWLTHKGGGLSLFVRALGGEKDALTALQARKPSELSGLFDTIAHCDVNDWLSENHPDLHRLFLFVRGEATSLSGLKHRKVTLKRVADILHVKYRDYRDADADGAASADGEAKQPVEGTAADVGCLIGEMHLHNQEFHKAIEAFSRAIDNNPAADAYQGRARAYRALAELDERAARLCETRS